MKSLSRLCRGVFCSAAMDKGKREVHINQEGGIGIFGFAVLATFRSVFWFCCSFQFADFTQFCIWFSVFIRNKNGFSLHYALYFGLLRKISNFN